MTPKKINITLQDASLLILVSAALLYTSGWSYAYHYFASYHLGLLDIAISKEYFFVYAFWVIRSQWLMMIIGFFVFFFACILINIWIKHLPVHEFSCKSWSDKIESGNALCTLGSSQKRVRFRNSTKC
ncbi:conserved hypothetical protein, membrane [Candidatus Magnetomorum sp. HK-1]|nr:conserved hypothetical protein, membrane [Candidatus Magnetomorum sp. HK-1]